MPPVREQGHESSGINILLHKAAEMLTDAKPGHHHLCKTIPLVNLKK